MDSSLVRKMEKAKNYAEQPHRITLLEFRALFCGDNASHSVSYEAGRWDCSCNYFQGHGTCSHTMAMGLVLKNLLAPGVAAP